MTMFDAIGMVVFLLVCGIIAYYVDNYLEEQKRDRS